jgi:hypothetical protein
VFAGAKHQLAERELKERIVRRRALRRVGRRCLGERLTSAEADAADGLPRDQDKNGQTLLLINLVELAKAVLIL